MLRVGDMVISTQDRDRGVGMVVSTARTRRRALVKWPNLGCLESYTAVLRRVGA